MLIVTAKLPRRRLALWSLAAAALCCCALMADLGPAHTTFENVATVSAVSPKGIKTNEDRLEFLQEYGWQAQPNPIATEELLIPKEFDPSYDEYLSLQSSQGFDLTRYAGKRIKRYTYEITNHPSGEKGVQANLLVYKNTVVGGELLSAQPDGFLHGFTMPT